MRDGSLEQKLDRMEARAEVEIVKANKEAKYTFYRKNKAAFTRIRAIMDGKEKPPAWCITKGQKERWKEKTLLKIWDDEISERETALIFGNAGKAAADRIKRLGLDLFVTAYSETARKLRE